MARKTYRTLKPVRVPAAIQAKYHAKLRKLVKQTHKSLLYWLKSVYKKNESTITDSPTSDISKEMKRLIRQWRRRYGDEARSLAKWLANETRKHTARNLQNQFKEVNKVVGGFNLEFGYMSQRERFVFNAIVESNVNLIKSIGEQYLTQVQGIVLRSIEVGNDLGEMTEQLESQYDITERRAAMIARDQTAKANENLSRVRLKDYGVTQMRWLHTSAGTTYRESHLEMDGEIYDINEGCYDVDYGGYIHPAELVNCRCVGVPIIPTEEEE